MITTVITHTYELARLPFVIIDHRLSNRLDETSSPRLAISRAIGSADKVAGALLSNTGILQRGVERIEDFDKLTAATRLERKATARREQARETRAEGRHAAEVKREAAQDRAASGLDEADATGAKGKQLAEARAKKAAKAKKAAADERAKQRVTTTQQRKKRVETAAEAKQRAARRKAKKGLDDAGENKQSATKARADAERLSELADAKKQKRSQG